MNHSIVNPAGFWRRLWANILDGLVIGVPLLIISYLVTGKTQGNVVSDLLEALYNLILPILWNGYTIGKRVAGVRIVKVNGEKIGFGTMLLRNLVGWIVYAATLGIGVIVSAFMVGMRKDKRAIHDFIAGTYVASEKIHLT